MAPAGPLCMTLVLHIEVLKTVSGTTMFKSSLMPQTVSHELLLLQEVWGQTVWRAGQVRGQLSSCWASC